MEVIVIILGVAGLFLVYNLRCMSEKEHKLQENLHTCRYHLIVLERNKESLKKANEKYRAIIIEQEKELQRLGKKTVSPIDYNTFTELVHTYSLEHHTQS